MTMIQFTQADYLRKAREIAGLSQDELAERLGVSRASIGNYEKRGTKKKMVLRLYAEITGVPESELKPQPSDYKSQVSRRPALSRPSNRSASTRPRSRA